MVVKWLKHWGIHLFPWDLRFPSGGHDSFSCRLTSATSVACPLIFIDSGLYHSNVFEWKDETHLHVWSIMASQFLCGFWIPSRIQLLRQVRKLSDEQWFLEPLQSQRTVWGKSISSLLFRFWWLECWMSYLCIRRILLEHFMTGEELVYLRVLVESRI